jgi:dolichol-phosphate hexosyltransferase
MTAVQPMQEQTWLPAEILPGTAAESTRDAIAAQALPGPEAVQPAIRPLESAVNSLPFRLSILISACNDKANIVQTISEVLKVDYPCAIELIVVDDGSSDGTYELLSQISDARLIRHRHETNQGRGAALLSAASLATGSHILLFDAALGYSAEDIPRILAPVLASRCSVVYGTLLCGYNTVRRSYRQARSGRLFTWLANVLFDACISDLHARLKLMPRAMLDGLVLREPGLGFDTEMTCLLLKQGIRPFEVPVHYYDRQHSSGKKISWRHALACVRILLQVRMRRRTADLRIPRRQEARNHDAAKVPLEHTHSPWRVDAV